MGRQNEAEQTALTVNNLWALEDRALEGDSAAIEIVVRHVRLVRAAAWGLLEQRGKRGLKEGALDAFERELLEACREAAGAG